MRHGSLSFCVAFILTLSLLLIPAVAPPVAVEAATEAELPNPLTVNFSATVTEGASYSFTVVPNATWGAEIIQFSRDGMVVNTNTPARFFTMSTAPGSISGDLSGSISFKWNRLNFGTPYLPAGERFIPSPDGVGILFINGTITGTILGNLTFIGAADLDYNSTLVKGEGRVWTVEAWGNPPSSAPYRVLIGEMSYQYVVASGAMTGTFNLRNYRQNPVGLEGRVNTTQLLVHSEGTVIEDTREAITTTSVKFVQFTKAPVDTSKTVSL